MSDNTQHSITRRQMMKTIVIGGVATTVMLPGKWTKPLVDLVVTPAHAASSAPPTTTSAPTPTPTPSPSPSPSPTPPLPPIPTTTVIPG